MRTIKRNFSVYLGLHVVINLSVYNMDREHGAKGSEKLVSASAAEGFTVGGLL